MRILNTRNHCLPVVYGKTALKNFVKTLETDSFLGCRNYSFIESWLHCRCFLEHLKISQSICFSEKVFWNTSECTSNFICYVGSSHNFKKQTYLTIDSLKTPYDYLSIMHYSKTAFGSGKVTIITKDPTMQEKIGQRDRMSDIDAIQLNRLYKCGIWYNCFYPGFIFSKNKY